MFDSTVCCLSFFIALVCLMLMNLHASSDFGASAALTESDENVFNEKVWQRLKEQQFLDYKPMTTNLDSNVYTIVRDEDSFNTSLLVGIQHGVYRLNGEKMTVIDKWDDNLKQVFNWHRLIMIDYKTRPKPSIISCGSTQNGICRLHNYNSLNVSQAIGNPNDPVNSIRGDPRSEVIAVSVSSKTIFFIHHQYDTKPLTQSLPILSARILEIPASGQPTFRYARQEKGLNSSFDILPNLKTKSPFLINKIFVYDGFLYYVRTYLLSSRLRTRLGRVSADKLSFTFYEETELRCKHQDQYFPSFTAAYFQSDNIGNSSQNFLVASFSKEQPTGTDGEQSVFCMFSMETIRQKFGQYDEKCSPNCSFISTHSTDLGSIFYKKSRNCPEDSEKDEFDNEFCWIPVAHRVSKCPLESKSVWKSSSQVYKFVTDQQGDDKILFYNEKNYLTKVVLPSDKPPYLTFKQYIFHEFISDLVLSKELRENKKTNDSFVYFGLLYKVVKFPLTSCSIYRTCVSCLSSNDPLDCGWCGTHCARRSECLKTDFTNETCSPIIYGFSPKKAPLAGGTILELRGQNFGEKRYGSLTIAGEVCLEKNIRHWDFNKIVVEVPPSKVEATGSIQVSLLRRVPFNISHSDKTIYSIGRSTTDSSFEYTSLTFEKVIPAEVNILKGDSLEVHVIGKNFDMLKLPYLVKLELTTYHGKPESFYGHILNTTHISFSVALPKKLQAAQYNITVLDDQFRTETGLVIEAVGNPVIESVDTATVRCSGDTSIIVKGSKFHRIQNIELTMDFYPHFQNWTKCTVNSASQMTCFAPKYPYNVKSGKQDLAVLKFFTQSFHLTYLGPKTWPIIYLPDPSFDNLPMDTKIYIDDPVLQLSGSDLGSDILISVGNWTCEILLEKQESNQLSCSIQFGGDIPVEGDFVAVGYRLRETDEIHILGNIVLFSRPTPEAVGFLKKHWYIPVTIAILILSFAIAIGYRKLRQRTSQRNRHQDEQHAEFQLSEYPQNSGVTNEYYNKQVDDIQTLFMSAPHESLKSEALDLLEKENKFIAKDRLILGDFIGEGHFGRVYKAQLWDINKKATENVAVKTLQTSASFQSELNVFIKEALIMKDFCHPRVLHLIGVSFLDCMSPVIVTPFMAKGDLLTFLRNDDKNLKVSDLIAFAVEIAEGMEYLASHKFVHRDLAARNCLLDHENHIKIADFGLSRDVYEKDYYRPEGKGLMPVKWMAPESLENSLFTTKSDVWSFGVTFWEITTRGLPPYSGIPAWHVIHFLKAGERLGKPNHCPASIYKVMTLCWSWDPKDRPTFTHILQDIHLRVENIEKKRSNKIIERKDVYVNVSKSPNYTHRMQIVWDDDV